jgi:hypothetical protein
MRRVNLKDFETLPPHMKTIQSLYIYLWMKEENNPKKPFKFRVPHTLLIKDNNISYWIFSDKQNVIKKKKSLNITIPNILKTFRKPRKQKRIDVIALYIYPDWRNTENLVTDYLTFEDLEQIIKEKQYRGRCGII